MYKKIITNILLSCLFVGMLQDFSYCKKLMPESCDIVNKKLFIPSNLGRISEEFQGNSDKKFIIIKDLHCDISLQKNVFEILKILKTNYAKNLKTIFVEGSPAKKINTSLISDIKTLEVKNNVVDFYFKKADLTGVELYKILYDKNVSLIGLEDLSAYIKNFEILYSMLQYQFTIGQLVDKNLNILKKRINIQAKAKTKFFLKNIEMFQNGEKNLTDNVLFLKRKYNSINTLSKTKFASKYPNLENFLYFNDIENINKKFDTSIIKLETSFLMKYIKNILNLEEQSNLKKYQAENSIAYYQYVGYLLKKYHINIQQLFPNLTDYLFFFNQDELDYIKILEERWVLEKEIIENLEDTKITKNILFLINFLNSFKSQLDSNSLKFDINFLIDNEFKFYAVCEELNVGIAVLIFKKYLELMKEFYSIADKRNEIFLRNIEDVSANEKLNVLFVGGYHVDGVIQILRSRNISYSVITPNITNTDTNYKEIYTSKMHKLSNWIYKQKIEIKESSELFNLGSIFLARPSLFLTDDKDIDATVKTQEEIVENQTCFDLSCLKKAWRHNRWECLGVFIYPSLFIITMITVFAISNPVFDLLFVSTLVISMLISAFAVLWAVGIYKGTINDSQIMRHIPKIVALLASIIFTFVVPAQPVIIAIIVASYIVSDIGASFLHFFKPTPQKTPLQKNSWKVIGVMSLLYITFFIAKIIMISPVIIAFSPGILIAFGIILTFVIIASIVLYTIFPEYRTKHIFRAMFYLLSMVNIFFAIIGLGQEYQDIFRTISTLATTITDITDYFAKIFVRFLKDKISFEEIERSKIENGVRRLVDVSNILGMYDKDEITKDNLKQLKNYQESLGIDVHSTEQLLSQLGVEVVSQKLLKIVFELLVMEIKIHKIPETEKEELAKQKKDLKETATQYKLNIINQLEKNKQYDGGNVLFLLQDFDQKINEYIRLFVSIKIENDKNLILKSENKKVDTTNIWRQFSEIFQIKWDEIKIQTQMGAISILYPVFNFGKTLTNSSDFDLGIKESVRLFPFYLWKDSIGEVSIKDLKKLLDLARKQKINTTSLDMLLILEGHKHLEKINKILNVLILFKSKKDYLNIDNIQAIQKSIDELIYLEGQKFNTKINELTRLLNSVNVKGRSISVEDSVKEIMKSLDLEGKIQILYVRIFKIENYKDIEPKKYNLINCAS
jgi:hypothetical protein